HGCLVRCGVRGEGAGAAAQQGQREHEEAGAPGAGTALAVRRRGVLGHGKTFFHSRSVANTDTGSAPLPGARVWAARTTAGSLARRNGLMRRSVSIELGSVGSPRSRWALHCAW